MPIHPKPPAGDLPETLRDIIPPVLMALGAFSLLRTSRVLSLAALGVIAYDIAARQDGKRRARAVEDKRVDERIAESFPASDPPAF